MIGGLREREMFVVAGLAVVTGSAALMEWLGLSTALGAFIAGVMLADTPYRHELEADIEPFRSILLGLFFLGVGMMLDLGAIAERLFFVAGMALALWLAYRVVLAVFFVPQAPLSLTLMQLVATIAVYPIVVFVSTTLLGVRRVRPGDAESLGMRA